MFAALMVARLREAVFTASTTPQLKSTRSWVSPDDVASTDLPLATATEKVLSSMHYVLERTMEARTAELATAVDEKADIEGTDEQRQFRKHLRETKAGEVRLIRNVHALRSPKVIFRAREWQSS
jgi:pyridoxine kinase